MDDIQALFSVMHRGLSSLKLLKFKVNQVNQLLSNLIDIRDQYNDSLEFGVPSSVIDDVEKLRKKVELLVNIWAFYNTNEFLKTWLKPLD